MSSETTRPCRTCGRLVATFDEFGPAAAAPGELVECSADAAERAWLAAELPLALLRAAPGLLAAAEHTLRATGDYKRLTARDELKAAVRVARSLP